MSDGQNLVAALARKQQPVKAIYISSYIPRKCGIATFTKHLTTAINNLNPRALAEIIAVTDKDQEYEYPWEVKMRIGQHHLPDYSMAAHYINQSSTDVVNLQHEFGLFGGVDGDYLLPLLDSIDKPLITNFHTILPEPDEHKAYIMRRIIDQSVAVIAMTNSSRQTLIDVYGCPPEKAVMIYHGVPDFTFNDIDKHKEHLRIKAEPMILTTGLLGPGKGLEYVIDAMSDIVKAIPNAKLYIVGQTHPHILREHGEAYREELTERIRKKKLTRSVVFVHRYLDDEEFKRYYQAADFFITAYPNIQQPTSGTLAYGLGSGKICISTPYHYAREVLAENTGILVEPRNSASIAKAIITTWQDAATALGYRERAYRKGRQMTWPNIGLSYVDLFRQILHQGGDNAYTNVLAPTNR
jgi:glycosyltransferase involved in cell wall biosynthesis